jgi:hypothetical protein
MIFVRSYILQVFVVIPLKYNLESITILLHQLMDYFIPLYQTPNEQDSSSSSIVYYPY